MRTETISIDQGLFGYEDGHRLLASSMELGDQASVLTHLSDLVPGTVFGPSDGYWTGLPLPNLARYALLRTWPAPEMPRPGCVWTHALLLPLSIFEVVYDLTVLQEVVSRPRGRNDYSFYARPKEIQVSSIRHFFGKAGDFAQDVSSLLLALYDDGGAATLNTVPGAMDQPLFAVWSQQWPRLRRNFRFQTATSREVRRSSATRLDLVFQLQSAEQSAHPLHMPAWVQAACSDILYERNRELRKFLWLYGNDVRKQRGSFRPLCEIMLLRDDPGDAAASDLLQLLKEHFPGANEAVRLKQDIVDGLVVPRAQVDVLWSIVSNPEHVPMPLPSRAGVARLAQHWPDRALNMLRLAERTAKENDPLSKAIFATVTGAIPLDDFWKLTATFPRVREGMIIARPDIILSQQALSLDNDSLASLLAVLPQDTDVADDFIVRLIGRDDACLAEIAFERFPWPTAVGVIAAFDTELSSVANAWLREMMGRPQLLLNHRVMRRITRASLIYDIAENLGWLSKDVVSHGTGPWLAAHVNARLDLEEDKLAVLGAFLIALALSAPGDGARRLFEMYFDAVHEKVLESRLPWKARDILNPLLPDLGWFRGWDFGLRLRLGVAKSYVENGYRPSSYRKLASGGLSRRMLADAALEIRGGAKLAEGLDS